MCQEEECQSIPFFVLAHRLQRSSSRAFLTSYAEGNRREEDLARFLGNSSTCFPLKSTLTENDKVIFESPQVSFSRV